MPAKKKMTWSRAKDIKFPKAAKKADLCGFCIIFIAE